MHPETAQNLHAALVLSLGIVSLCVWPGILRSWLTHGSILAYRPRHAVPWGSIGVILIGLLFFVPVVSRLFGGQQADPPPGPTAPMVWQLAGFELLLTAAVVLVLVIGYRASRADLGLPGSFHAALHDVKIGVLAALAALAPVYLVLYALVSTLGETSQNPLLQKLVNEPSTAVFAAAVVAAVLAAPLFEELVYRLLVQGWLEKILMGRESENEPSRAKTEWLPILITSALFAAAHAGLDYGYSPVPLFLFAIVLGYVYQRTHHILPSVVAHMAFNGITILLMWLQIQAGKTPQGL
jgi:membrane protease YdiL (CAAX protease family)